MFTLLREVDSGVKSSGEVDGSLSEARQCVVAVSTPFVVA